MLYLNVIGDAVVADHRVRLRGAQEPLGQAPLVHLAPADHGVRDVAGDERREERQPGCGGAERLSLATLALENATRLSFGRPHDYVFLQVF